jgi:hypothetical protein
MAMTIVVFYDITLWSGRLLATFRMTLLHPSLD